MAGDLRLLCGNEPAGQRRSLKWEHADTRLLPTSVNYSGLLTPEQLSRLRDTPDRAVSQSEGQVPTCCSCVLQTAVESVASASWGATFS